MRRRGKVASLIAAVVMACVLLWAPSAMAEGQQTPSTIDELLDVYGVADQPADFVVVIDTSGSMSDGLEPIYPEVKEAYSAFLDATTDGDFLSLITFDAQATLRFSSELTDDTRAEALESIPKTAEGGGTNIAAAIRMTIDQLDRADAKDVQLVVFLTDGDPTLELGANYSAMRDDADAATQGRQVRVLGASLGSDEQTGATLLEKVFPGNTQVVALPNDQLKGFFEDAIKRARIAQLYQPIRDDLEQGAIQVDTSNVTLADPLRVEFTLTNDYGPLGATVTVEGATVSTADGEALPTVLDGGRRTMTLAPGETSEPLVVEVDSGVADAPLRAGEATEDQYYQLEVNASVRVEPSDLIAQNVSLDSTGAVSQEPQTQAARTYGIPYWQIGAALVALALLVWLLVFLWRRFVATPSLWGSLVTTQGDRHYPLRGKKVTIPNDRAMPAGAGKMASAEFSTRRAKFHRGKPQIFVTVDGEASVTSNAHRVTQWPHRLRRGDIVKLERAKLEFQEKPILTKQEN